MEELVIGSYVLSKAGHDTGKCYVIINIDGEYVYLADGKIRTLDRPKKKKKKHVRSLGMCGEDLSIIIRNGSVRNEDIKRAVKMVPVVYSSKEVK
jgi:ribosomal protein L14E/L6E/L27E